VKNSLLKNSFYNTAGGVLKITLGIITIPLLIRQLGVEEYGLWTLASAVIGVVTLAEAGLSTATTVFVAQDLGEDVDGLSQTLTVTLTMMLMMATLAAVALWFGANPITHLFPQLKPLQAVEVSKAFQMGALAVWARLVQQVLVGVEQAYQRYDLVNIIGTMQSLLISIGMLSISYFGGRTLELMEWQAAAGMLILLSHISVVRYLFKNTSIRMIWAKEKAIQVGKYSFMVWLSSLGGVLFTRVDRLIVGSMLGTQVLGIYSAITDITGQINGISALPIQPLVPLLGNLSLDNCIETIDLKQKVKKFVEINAFVALGLGASLISLAPFLLKIVLARECNEDYITVFRLATIIYSIYSLNAVGYYILFGVKAANISAIIQLIVGIISLIVIATGAYTFGLLGAVVGNVAYVGVYGLTFLGMKYMGISIKSWLSWVLFPIAWFIVVTLSGFLLHSSFLISMLVLGLQIVILSVWFALKYKTEIIQA
jgi:O-antigen/teichoic acid export membrane protein